MTSFLTTVTDAEAKVVETVRSFQQPVVDYVRKGVELADSRLPDVTYPESLPKPGEVLDTQFAFVRNLLDAQQDFVKAIVETVAPLAGAERPAATAPAAAKKAAKSA